VCVLNSPGYDVVDTRCLGGLQLGDAAVDTIRHGFIP